MTPQRWHGPRQPARTVLEQLIRERQQTFEEFAEYAETFARNHGEPGTISLRHLQRLVAGRQLNAPLGPLRPATARLLERMFGRRADELLAAPAEAPTPAATELALVNAVQVLRVAVAVVVRESEVLLVRRRSSDGVKLSWQFPAGVVKPGASPEVVAITETLAETGVHCSVQRSLGRRIHPVTNVLCDYLFCIHLMGQAANADIVENVSVCWVDKFKLAQFIPARQVFPPVLMSLGLQRGVHRV
jgi:8-oxo-dGTP pyrophosphatase MutT (NUDIX family)